MNNPCTECGKQRIDGKSWEEKVGNVLTVQTLTVCPDAECQKIVDKALADKQEKNFRLAKDRAKAKLERTKLMSAS